MSIVRLVAVAALVLPGVVFASNTFNVASSGCSGALVSSYIDGLSFACTGDFSLSDGAMVSDTFIALSATGSLRLANMSLTAQTITLDAGRQLDVDAGTYLDIAGSGLSVPLRGSIAGGTVQIRDPAISQSVTRPVVNWERFDIAAGATVHFQQPGTIQLNTVPEPDSVALLVAGLMAMGLVFRKSAKA
jgi:hypothetical protein